MQPSEVLQVVAILFGLFLDREHELLANDANERSLTHKLAEYLQGRFTGWNVDCEYNRRAKDVKRIPGQGGSGERVICPDIIVHKRGERENLVVIEVKKSTNRERGDDEKLRALTDQTGAYGYRLGIHLVINCKQGAASTVTCYRDGTLDVALSDQANEVFAFSRSVRNNMG